MVEAMDITERQFLLLHEKDNTLTAIKDLARGTDIRFGPDTEGGRITLRQRIPYAHKFARTLIPKCTDVIKYGEVIGIATSDIRSGDHVHVHNVESKRLRGGGS